MLRFFWGLFALTAALGGAGYWNYQRNAYLDEDMAPQKRPYRTLSDSDLALLEKAYRDELAGFTKQVDRYARSGGPASRGAADLGGKIDDFSRAQAGASRMREAQLGQREQEVVLEQIARERQIRASGLASPWSRIRRRLLTL